MIGATGVARERSWGGGTALVVAVALGATLLMAAPVLVRPGERLFGSGRTLGAADPNRDPLLVIAQMEAGRIPAPYLQPVTDWPGRALSRIVGGVAAFNALVLVSFPLSAGAAYLLARHAVGSHLGAMVAGLAFAFLPFHVTQAAGHLHPAQTQWLPLYLLALWRFTDRPGVLRAGLLVSAAGLVALSDFYGGFIAAVLSPAAVLAFAVAPGPDTSAATRVRRAALAALLLGAMAAGALAVIHLFAPAVLMSPESLAFPRADLFAWSARWWSYLVPPVDHPLLGSAVRSFWARRGLGASLLEHQQVSLPFALLVLAVVPLALCLRGQGTSLGTRRAPFLMALAGFALLCSLSPERSVGPLTFVRPSAMLYELAPMFRAYARFSVAVGLMAALLAGAGAAWLWNRPGWSGRRTAILLFILLALEQSPFPPWPWRDVLPTRAHRFLAEAPGPLRVLDCVPPTRLSDTLAAARIPHPTAILGPDTVEDCGQPGLGDRLRAAGFTHALVRLDSPVGQWWAGQASPPGLRRGPAFDDSLVLDVTAAPPAAYVATLQGFWPREYEQQGSWRFMAARGMLLLQADRAVANVHLELELMAFPEERTVQWSLEGGLRGEFKVGPTWRRYRLPLGALSPGLRRFELACRDPAVVADHVLRNGDARPLALALASWKLQSAAPAERRAGDPE